jgi:hypothetical protein
MLFVADQIPTELKRIIEFLNEQMDPAEVLGIEIRQFTDGKLKTIAPFVIGQTSGAETRKQSVSSALSPPREGLQEAVDIFNALAAGHYTAIGTVSNYRQIKISGFPATMHYEFVHTRANGITAEFHIESKKYASVSEELQAIAKETPEINGGRVEFDPKWSHNRGRVRVLQHENNPTVAATTMLKLIEVTKARIGQAIALCS